MTHTAICVYVPSAIYKTCPRKRENICKVSLIPYILKTDQLTIQGIPEVHSPGVKQPEREADDSPPSSAKAKNALSYILTPPIRLHDVLN